MIDCSIFFPQEYGICKTVSSILETIVRTFIYLMLVSIFSGQHYYAEAQPGKGFLPGSPAMLDAEGKTYASIYGISENKSPVIPSMQYTDRDPTAFRSYLFATGVDSINITLLLNEKTFNEGGGASLNYLTDLSKSRDKFYIYVNDHGDVENKNGIQSMFIADDCRTVNLAGGREGMEAKALPQYCFIWQSRL